MMEEAEGKAEWYDMGVKLLTLLDGAVRESRSRSCAKVGWAEGLKLNNPGTARRGLR